MSRHVNVGGNADVRGHLRVGHNLRVAGWLDAANIKGALKGLYASEEALVRTYPRPQPGWYALVGDGLPADVWRAEDGRWVPTGEQGGEPELWLDDLQERMDEAEEAIEAESEARKAADMSLAASIAAESEARQGADAALAGRIDSEAAARVAADTELAASITAETEAREKADAAILGTVDIGDLDSVTVNEGLASVMGRGPHRFNVMDDGKVVGLLQVLGDEMLHVCTQVLTTHRSIDKEGNLITAHRDDVVNIYYRSMGLRNSSIPSGTWTRWKKLQTELVQERGDSDEVAMSQKAVTDELVGLEDGLKKLRAETVMAIEVDPETGDVTLLYDEDNTSLADAYIDERGDVVIEMAVVEDG